MKYVCPPGTIWQIRRRLRRVKLANVVFYSYPCRLGVIYVRRYVVPRNPRTPAQAGMRQLFGALSRDWLGLLTPPQREAWTAFARNYHRRWGAPWIAEARRLNCWQPHTLTAYDRRRIWRWLVGGRPLTGPQAYVKLNSVLGRIGRPKLLWPPPPPVPLRLNPVQEVRLRWDDGRGRMTLPPSHPRPDSLSSMKWRRGLGRGGAFGSKQARASTRSDHPPGQCAEAPAGRLRLELVVKRHIKHDLLLFGSAPCSAGWSNMRRPVYLGLLPSPGEGVHDITALYLARFRAPGPNQQVFIRVCQHRYGWESAPQDLSACVPPEPAPQSPPNLNPNPNLARHCALRTLALRPPHSPIRIPHSYRPSAACTRGARFPRASVAANVSWRSLSACRRRKTHCRELWRGT